MRVLVTCPPMLGMIDEFRPKFEAANVELVAAQVVQVMEEDELERILPGFDGWIIGDDIASARVLGAGVSGRLKAIVKWGVGVDNVDLEAAKAMGLKACNTPSVFGREVADLAMNYVSGLARHTFFIDREIRKGDAWPKPAGISLAGKTVALVGYGDIGRNTAKRLLAADMRLNIYDPAFADEASEYLTPRVWPEALNQADFLIFTCPLLPMTHHMFNADILSKLKRGVRVVNVGRGQVIHEEALIRAIEEGIVHSVALDVFEIEPLPTDSPLRNHPFNIFGSHNASNTIDAVRRVSNQAIDLLFRFLKVAK
ncbi:MAG: phosphoglycerate dehydrogenase [Sphingomonadales bacterium BRH_c3]|nr:MAG: phosphoglycerate dehydrogenase [Sphingomonadales bacterium BRH_c3]